MNSPSLCLSSTPERSAAPQHPRHTPAAPGTPTGPHSPGGPQSEGGRRAPQPHTDPSRRTPPHGCRATQSIAGSWGSTRAPGLTYPRRVTLGPPPPPPLPRARAKYPDTTDAARTSYRRELPTRCEPCADIDFSWGEGPQRQCHPAGAQRTSNNGLSQEPTDGATARSPQPPSAPSAETSPRHGRAPTLPRDAATPHAAHARR